MKAREAAVSLNDEVILPRIKMVATALVTISILGLVVSTAHGESMPGWRSDVHAAFEEAETSAVPVILLITADGCPACAEFAAEADHASAVSALDRMVKVQAEASQYPDLVSRYALDGTPTIVVFAPDMGYDTPVYCHTGVLTTDEIVRLAGMVQPQDAGESTIESANPNADMLESNALHTDQSQLRVPAPKKRRVIGRLFASVGRLTARIVR